MSSDLKERLARLGLAQYSEVFVTEGFDTWETVLDITESDLSHLNVKLGHRRKLQRAIAESRGQSSDRPLTIATARGASAEGSYRSDDSATEGKAKQTAAAGDGSTGTSTKRKYRRHPKPDENAPERPPSAYVIFSNQVRELLKGQDLSFTEIAKVVGERWQVLPAEEREACERQANSAKEKYYAGLAEYKKTAQYEAYQKYLEEFRAKHNAPTKVTDPEGKRSKLETETSTSTRASSHDQTERAVNRRLSAAVTDPLGAQHVRGSTPPAGPTRLPAGPLYPSKPTSPASHPLSGFNSPRSGELYSPISASPHSNAVPRDAPFDISANHLPRDMRGSLDTSAPYPLPAYMQSHQPPSTTSTPLNRYVSHYQNPLELPSRRSNREPLAHLPGLSHEDTTLSSESGHSNYSLPQATQPVLMDPAKSMRVLPQPIPNIGPAQSPLDRTLHHPPSGPTHMQLPPPDYRTQGSLAALVRAGEIAARVADDESMDRDDSP
ncbi:HMG box protein [Stagonosporopsis vannaccii]|nr:HMG box protein [Stagonosporopsis vannaccii]